MVSEWGAIVKRIIAIILSAATVNAPAFELTLTEPEREQCEAEGGCVVISRALLQHALDKAQRLGLSQCEKRV